MREQSEAVVGRVPIREGLVVELSEAEPPLVPRDHTELGGERGDLRGEHLMVHEKAVPEDHRRAVSSGILVVETLAIDLCVRHRSSFAQ